MDSIIYSFIRWWVGSGLFDRIRSSVMEMIDSDKTNDEKREYVIQLIKSEFDLIKVRLIDLVISIVLIKIKG